MAYVESHQGIANLKESTGAPVDFGTSASGEHTSQLVKRLSAASTGAFTIELVGDIYRGRESLPVGTIAVTGPKTLFSASYARTLWAFHLPYYECRVST